MDSTPLPYSIITAPASGATSGPVRPNLRVLMNLSVLPPRSAFALLAHAPDPGDPPPSATAHSDAAPTGMTSGRLFQIATRDQGSRRRWS
jgi:hypothetical protein